MHTLARPPVREAGLTRQAGARGFTLIELLTVIAIIAILAAITFGVVKGVNERAAIGQAKVELSVLAQALEAYKKQYGDYPWTTDKVVLYNALTGKVGPKGATITGGGRRFIETSKFSLNATDPDAAGNYFLDPWGREYKYYYKIDPGVDGSGNPNPVVWRAVSYVLYSSGPVNSSETPPTTAGVVNTTAAGNLDNIYAKQ